MADAFPTLAEDMATSISDENTAAISTASDGDNAANTATVTASNGNVIPASSTLGQDTAGGPPATTDENLAAAASTALGEDSATESQPIPVTYKLSDAAVNRLFELARTIRPDTRPKVPAGTVATPGEDGASAAPSDEATADPATTPSGEWTAVSYLGRSGTPISIVMIRNNQQHVVRAIKIYPQKRAYIDKANREVQMLSNLPRHPNIVECLGHDSASRVTTMKFYNGEDMAFFARSWYHEHQCAVPEIMILHWLASALDALAFLAEGWTRQGRPPSWETIFHRNITPENFLVHWTHDAPLPTIALANFTTASYRVPAHRPVQVMRTISQGNTGHQLDLHALGASIAKVMLTHHVGGAIHLISKVDHDIGLEYLRQATGPYDTELLDAVESISFCHRTGRAINYQGPLQAASQICPWARARITALLPNVPQFTRPSTPPDTAADTTTVPSPVDLLAFSKIKFGPNPVNLERAAYPLIVNADPWFNGFTLHWRPSYTHQYQQILATAEQQLDQARTSGSGT